MLTSLRIPRDGLDLNKVGYLVNALRGFARVEQLVKEKSAHELLDHYQLEVDLDLTSLGMLCLGQPQHRAQLGNAPLIQLIKFDEFEQ